VDGNDYVSATVPSNGKVTKTSNGAVLETTRDHSDSLEVTYNLPRRALPRGASIHSVDVRICGSGEGDFYEVYGPPDAEPNEYEVTPPNPDGCWHFNGATGSDLSVVAATMLQSRMLIEKIEYVVTFDRKASR
jgi:hypothetical protein